MSGKKPGLSLERHKELGRELFDLSARLCQLAAELGNAYPRTNRAHYRAIRAKGEIDELRSILDDMLFKEHLGHVDKPEPIYYHLDDVL